MKILKAIIVLILVFAAALCTVAYFSFEPTKNPQWGVTFSPTHAQYLGFDWKTMYLDILNDLQPKNLRLIAYWENLEPQPDKWNFQDVHEMLLEADKRNIKVILAVGHKTPRWPECHHPAWFNDLTKEQQDAAQIKMVKKVVEEFKSHSSIEAWQVENEPYFNFGPMCPKSTEDLLVSEINAVKEIDQRPILLTDSGELGRWIPLARLNPDIFGTTMYRVVYHHQFGYFEYPLPPAFFRIKAGLVTMFSDVKHFWGVELQAEPWFEKDIDHTDLQTQLTLMNPKLLQDNIEYARATGLEKHYFWGVEWWYWMAQKQNDWGMWGTAKELFQDKY